MCVFDVKVRLAPTLAVSWCARRAFQAPSEDVHATLRCLSVDSLPHIFTAALWSVVIRVPFHG